MTLWLMPELLLCIVNYGYQLLQGSNFVNFRIDSFVREFECSWHG